MAYSDADSLGLAKALGYLGIARHKSQMGIGEEGGVRCEILTHAEAILDCMETWDVS